LALKLATLKYEKIYRRERGRDERGKEGEQEGERGRDREREAGRGRERERERWTGNLSRTLTFTQIPRMR